MFVWFFFLCISMPQDCQLQWTTDKYLTRCSQRKLWRWVVWQIKWQCITAADAGRIGPLVFYDRSHPYTLSKKQHLCINLFDALSIAKNWQLVKWVNLVSVWLIHNVLHFCNIFWRSIASSGSAIYTSSCVLKSGHWEQWSLPQFVMPLHYLKEVVQVLK